MTRSSKITETKVNPKKAKSPKTEPEAISSSSNVKTIKQLFDDDNAARLEVAKTYLAHGDDVKVDYDKESGQVFGLATAQERVLRMAIAASRKHADSTTFTVHQILRLKDVEGGQNQYLVIQGDFHYIDQMGQQKQAFFEVGRYQKPIYTKRPSGYSSTTGELEGWITEQTDIEDVYTIPFSAEQLEALKPHFDKQPSFILQTGARKFTVTYDQLIDEDYDAVAKRVQPKFQRLDGAIE